MYAILAICVALCPQRVDEQVHSGLREKHNDQIIRIQRGYTIVLFLFSYRHLVHDFSGFSLSLT